MLRPAPSPHGRLTRGLVALMLATLAILPEIARIGPAYGSPGDIHDGPRRVAVMSTEQQPVAAVTNLAGIDISHWNGSVNWSSVATSGVKFAVMKATQNTTYTDPTMAGNVAAAESVGIVAGTYHFASPNLTPGSAAAQADHYLSVSWPKAGRVLPVLDLEQTNGLSVSQLQDWTKAYLNRILERTGIHALIYSGNYFWRSAMGDTSWFAENGWRALWVPHWGVSSPSVPANNWGGNGWRVWQWTDCRSVPGISGCVDGNWLKGADIRVAQTAQIDITKPIGGSITGKRIKCGTAGSVCSRFAAPRDQVVLSVTPDAERTFVGWGGACKSAGTSPTCTVSALGTKTVKANFGGIVTINVSGLGAGTVNSSPAGLSCSTTCSYTFPIGTALTLSAVPEEGSFVGSWGSNCVVTESVCGFIVKEPINIDVRFDKEFLLPQDGLGAAFGWATIFDTRALGGSYHAEKTPAASISFKVSGQRLAVYVVAGPNMGKFNVLIDGRYDSTWDGYSKSFRVNTLKFVDLGPGEHVMTFKALGTSAVASADTLVGIDGIDLPSGFKANPKPISTSWSTVASVSASDGSIATSTTAGSWASLDFQGSAVTWLTSTGPTMGIAEVYIDDVLVRTIDLYSPVAVFGVQRVFSGLTYGPHWFKIVVTGNRSSSSTGNSVSVDGWITV